LSRSAFWRWLLSLVLAALVVWLTLALPGAVARAKGTAVRIPAAPASDIVSPSSASGPIQTGVQVQGQGWNPNETIKLFYNPSAQTPPTAADCGDPANAPTLSQNQPLAGPLTADQNGNWVANFQWPGTSTGLFAVCIFDPNAPEQVVPANQGFRVLSSAVPTISTPQPAFFNGGDMITINLNNFLPGNQPIDVKITNSLANQAQATLLATVTVDANGNASQQVTLPTTLSGNLQLFAASHPAPGAAPGVLPPLFASQALSVGAVTATPGPTETAAPSPTAPPTVTAVAPGTGGNAGAPKSSTSSTILTLLVVLLGLVILAIFGVLIWYFLGIRPPVDAPAGPAMGPPPARTRAQVTPRGSMRGRYPSQDEEADEWEDQQGPWEEDTQGGWSGSDWGQGNAQWDQRGGYGPPPRGGPSGGGRTPPPRGGSGGRSRPGTGNEWQRPAPGQEDW
jgi:hypothetical protein